MCSNIFVIEQSPLHFNNTQPGILLGRVHLFQSATRLEHFGLYIVFIALTTSLLHYAWAVRSFARTRFGTDAAKQPPVVPHVLPFIGSIPLGFWWDPLRFVTTARNIFNSSHPVKVRLFFSDCYLLQGATNILALFKQRDLSAFFVHGALLQHVFCLPDTAAATYQQDCSGERIKPRSDCEIETRNRVDFLTRNSFNRFLAGSGFPSFWRRFERNAAVRLSSLDVGCEWKHLGDFADIFHNDLTSAVVDAMCGPLLLQKNPQFTKDFWILDRNIMPLFTRTAWLIAPGAVAARDRALRAVKEWHAQARQEFEPSKVGCDGDDPFWGTRFFRERQDMFYNMDGFDADAIASQELAFVWGANTNAIISAFWSSIEVFRDVELLEATRAEILSCIVSKTTSHPIFDIERLVRQPLLQAIFAETLRLRVNGFLVRCPSHDDLTINGYTIPRDHVLLTNSTPGHMDPAVWSAEENADHPPHEFWVGRFLRHERTTGVLEFQLDGKEGSWMPFGGGNHICPGRRFAKYEIILTVAFLATMYDVELVEQGKAMKMSTRNFGFGTLSPRGKVPVRIRRRWA